MTPVDMTSACSGRADGLSCPRGHLSGVGIALVARAGVGHARVNRHDANRIARRALPINLYRCGTDQIFCVHAGGNRGPIGDD